MELDWLELNGYRCYANLHFEPASGVNVLVGNNGAGKTSVLEAIAYLGLLRSFRGTPDESIVSIEAESAVLRGEFSIPSGSVRVEVEIPQEGRRAILLNGKRPKRNRDVLAQVPVVVFHPDDLAVVKRGPGLRRGYLDDLAAQLRPQAAADQQEYDRALRQRNALLRQEGRSADRTTLDAWDARVTEAGARVFVDRLRVLDALDGHLGEAYRLVGARGRLAWEYISNWGATAADDLAAAEVKLSNALAARRDRDLDQRTTTAGPHRDDPFLVVDGRPARTMASQGEQRTIAVSLKVGAYRVLAQERPTLPILLLDDVFSELDPRRARGVLDLFGGGQVFVTTARDDDVPVDGRRWVVEGGVVR
ncbi:MAG: DNA replication/repair protein RecF [Acidobacteria bacterium]|nr:DNA replication/repair protein RecF [Acidobacteriota bacterium]